MKCATSSARCCARTSIFFFAVFLVTALTTSCGSGGSNTPPPPQFSGDTQVAVLLTSAANDQITRFATSLQTLILTSQSGAAVTLFSSPQPAEFMHLNGAIEPFATVSVPQGIYTSATATFGGTFVCIAQDPAVGGLYIANYSVLNQGPTITLPAPITITGSNIALSLDMQVSESAPFPACYSNPPFEGFSMTPTFTLAPLTLSSSPTSPANGKLQELEGQVATLDSANSQMSLTVPEGPAGTITLSVAVGTATVFQGISGYSALASGMFVNMDGALQPNGSIAAQRIAVEDPSAVNMLTGPLLSIDSETPVLTLYGRQEQGPLSPTGPGGSAEYFDIPEIDFSTATFGISGQLTNVQNLPFVASFNAANMVAGQNVDLSTGPLSLTGGVYTVGNTITLIPQTVDATVVASSTGGNGFTDYTVSLAPYDLFPTLAVQPGQTTLLNNPSQMEVYVDSSTHQLNTQTLAPGGTFRFYGLVFNDDGTLSMDCAQVNDGVGFTAPGNANNQMRAADVQTIRRQGAGGLPQITSVGTTSR
jgi:hypothetical protein